MERTGGGRHNRQGKSQAVELSDIKKDDIDPNEWQDSMADLMGKLVSGRVEDRVQATKTIQHLFTTVFVGNALDQYMNDIIMAVLERFRDQCDEEEHQNLCLMVSVLALNMGEEFEPYAETLLGEILHGLPRLADNERHRLAMIAVITSFCIKTIVSRRGVVNALIDFVSGKGKERSTELKSDALHALSVVLSCAEDELFEEVLPRLHDVLGSRLASTKFEILKATVELASVIYDYLRAQDDKDNSSDDRLARDFKNNYNDRVNSVHRKLVSGKKADTKELQKKAVTLIKQFEGEILSERICLHSQNVDFLGKRPLVLLKAVRLVSRCNFEAQMARNPALHSYFSYKLLTPAHVARLRKKHGVTMKRQREEDAKEREMDRDKKRRQKDDRQEREDD